MVIWLMFDLRCEDQGDDTLFELKATMFSEVFETLNFVFAKVGRWHLSAAK